MTFFRKILEQKKLTLFDRKTDFWGLSVFSGFGPIRAKIRTESGEYGRVGSFAKVLGTHYIQRVPQYIPIHFIT
jgi:hypothetical protein